MGEKLVFFRAKNLSVNTWRLGADIFSLICGFMVLGNITKILMDIWEKFHEKNRRWYKVIGGKE